MTGPETGLLQGIGSGMVNHSFSEAAFRKACGNAMSVNVLTRLLCKLLVHCGLACDLSDPWDLFAVNPTAATLSAATCTPEYTGVETIGGSPWDDQEPDHAAVPNSGGFSQLQGNHSVKSNLSKVDGDGGADLVVERQDTHTSARIKVLETKLSDVDGAGDADLVVGRQDGPKLEDIPPSREDISKDVYPDCLIALTCPT